MKTIVLTSLLLPAFVGVPLLQAQDQPPRRADRGPRLEAILERADTNGDGKISLEEFTAARTQEMKQAFDRFDTNQDGFIDSTELEAMQQRMRDGFEGGEGGRRPRGAPEDRGPRPPDGLGAGMGDAAFDRLDTNGDGSLSREEFSKGMEQLRAMRDGEGGPRRRPPADSEAGSDGGFRRPPPAATAPDTNASAEEKSE